jgi:hypothetical protein
MIHLHWSILIIFLYCFFVVGYFFALPTPRVRKRVRSVGQPRVQPSISSGIQFNSRRSSRPFRRIESRRVVSAQAVKEQSDNPGKQIRLDEGHVQRGGAGQGPKTPKPEITPKGQGVKQGHSLINCAPTCRFYD